MNDREFSTSAAFDRNSCFQDQVATAKIYGGVRPRDFFDVFDEGEARCRVRSHRGARTSGKSLVAFVHFIGIEPEVPAFSRLVRITPYAVWSVEVSNYDKGLRSGSP